jgi:thiamine kinase-like enzyme
MKILYFLNCLIFLQIYADVDWPKIIKESSLFPSSYMLTEIFGGASNHNYHLFLDGADYFIRLAPIQGTAPYANLDIEYEALVGISNLGIFSKPIYYNIEKRVLVTEFIHHDQQKIDLLNPEIRSGVFTLLHKIEDSFIKVRRIFEPYKDLKELIEKSDIHFEEVKEVFLPVLKQIDLVLAKNKKQTLCHLDLHNKNILRSYDQFWLVDWEYATMSHPFLVLASMASIERWSDQQMEQLLNDYVENPSREDFYRLYLYRIVADLFWTVWNEIQAKNSTIDNPYESWKELFYSAALERIYSQITLDAIESL